MTTIVSQTPAEQITESNNPQSEENTTPAQSLQPPNKMSTPRRLLFISSIGNQKPYRSTRHSAGHILLDALSPLLPSSLPATSYTTWYSPSYMNESGPKLVRQLQRWFEKIDKDASGPSGGWISSSGVALPLGGGAGGAIAGAGATGTPATLVILHDELEQPLGKVRVKRGGPEASSLRGHRGLISVCESLRGKGLYPPKQSAGAGAVKGNNAKGKGGGLSRDLSILRVGVGIGRPESRGKNAVADYVLTEMNERELAAVRGAVGTVMGVLEEELVFEGK